MTVFTENVYTKEFVVSQSNGTRSYEEITVVAPVTPAGTSMVNPGTLLEFDGTNYVPLTAGGTVAAILATPAPEGESQQTGAMRDLEVLSTALTYPDPSTDAEIETINAAMSADLSIQVRTNGIVVT